MDTGDGIVASLQLMQEKLKLKNLPEQMLRLFLGPPLKVSLMKYYGVTYEETEYLTEVYRDCYLEVGIDKTRLFKNIVNAFTSIRNSSAKSAVATLKQHQLASATLENVGLDKIVDYISLNLNNSLGDKAELVEDCIQHLGCINKKEAIMFGDSPNDAEAAQRAGIDFVALKFGEGFKKEGALEKYPYKFIVNNEDELSPFIINLIKGEKAG